MAVGLGGTVLFSEVPAPPESAEFAAIADPLRDAGVPEAVFDDCADEDDEEMDYPLGCSALAVDGADPGRVRIAVGKVGNVAGYWSGEDAALRIPPGSIPATTRVADWGSELPLTFGESTVWIDVEIPAGRSGAVTGEAYVEVRYPKRKTTQQGNVTITGFTNTSTRLSRDVRLYFASSDEMEQLAALAETGRDDYPIWQLALQYAFGIVFVGSIGWLIVAAWKESRRDRRGWLPR
jgi:hypothetical protein